MKTEFLFLSFFSIERSEFLILSVPRFLSYTKFESILEIYFEFLIMEIYFWKKSYAYSCSKHRIESKNNVPRVSSTNRIFQIYKFLLSHDIAPPLRSLRVEIRCNILIEFGLLSENFKQFYVNLIY